MTHGESAWSLSDLSLWPPLSYNINCQSVSTLNLRSKTLWGFHIKVLSIRVVGIGGSVRTLDPSLPASRKLPAPNPPSLTALPVFTSLPSVYPTIEFQQRRPETVEWWEGVKGQNKDTKHKLLYRQVVYLRFRCLKKIGECAPPSTK